MRSGWKPECAVSPGLNSTLLTKGGGPGTGLVGIMGKEEHPSPSWRTWGSPARNWLSLILLEVIDRECVNTKKLWAS